MALDQPDQDRLRSYGRRKGKRLRDSRARLVRDLLPKIHVDLEKEVPAELSALFSQPCKDVWLEIGFGGGEHLAAQAAANLDIGFIGAEPFLNGVSSLLVLIDEQGLSNIRVLDDDVRPMLDWFGEGQVGRAFILFPDPWPKKRHHKRRLVATPMLDQLARVLRPGAELRIASDIGDYLRTTLLALRAHSDFEWLDEGPSDWRNRREDWPGTRYEQKAHEAGRRCAYLTFRRK